MRLLRCGAQSKIKRKILSVTVLALLAVLCLTACGPSLEGTWYELGKDPDNASNRLLISDEGTFIVDDVSGTWSMSDDTMMLMTPFDAETLFLTETDYGQSLVSDDGDVWIQDYDAALEYFTQLEYYEEEQERMEEEERMQEIELRTEYFDEAVAGSYVLDSTGMSIAYEDTRAPFMLELSGDGTYVYSCKDMDGEELIEKGLWELDPDTFDTDLESYDSMDLYLTPQEFSPALSEYRDKSGIDPSLCSIYDLVARVEYEDNWTKEMVIDIDYGLGFSSGEVFLPGGTYRRSE